MSVDWNTESTEHFTGEEQQRKNLQPAAAAPGASRPSHSRP